MVGVPMKVNVKTVLTAIVVVLVGITASAQLADQAKLTSLAQSNTLGVRPAASPLGLLDLSRMHWYHSYSVSFFSGSGRSGSVGLFNSMMVYEWSSKLTLGLQLALMHDIAGVSRVGAPTASVFPGLWLDFHPSSKFRMSLAVQTVPGGYGYYPYGSGYAWPRYWSPY